MVQLWLSLGISFLAFVAGLQTIDKSLYEAGVIDGIRNRFQELWYITLPSMIPQLAFGAVMQIISSFSVADVSIELAGFPSTGYAGETVVTHIMDYGNIRYEFGYACAMAVVLVSFMVCTNKVVSRLLNKVGK
jgi:multiple sugar transport system permease protein